MSGQYCPDCEMGSMKPATGPGRHPARCAMCGWEGDLHSVPYKRRLSSDEFSDVSAEHDPTVPITLRIRRGLDEAASERVWDAASKVAGGTGSASWSLRSRHRTFLVPRGAPLGARFLAVEGVERVVSGDDESGLWSRWLNHDVHFLRVQVRDGQRDAMETAIMDLMVPDVERGSWAQNGDYLLRLMDAPLPGQIAALQAIDGVGKVIAIEPAGPGAGQ